MKAKRIGTDAATLRMLREAERIERKVARLKATLIPVEVVARHVAAIQDVGDRRLRELLIEARPALAEAQTADGKREIIQRIADRLLVELEARRAEALTMPTVADLERRRLN